MAQKIETGSIVKIIGSTVYGIADEYDAVDNIWYVETYEYGIMLVVPWDLEVVQLEQVQIALG